MNNDLNLFNELNDLVKFRVHYHVSFGPRDQSQIMVCNSEEEAKESLRTWFENEDKRVIIIKAERINNV